MFQWNPQDYAKNSSAQLTWARELISRLNLQGNESVLDVGCGDGKITAELSRTLPKGYILGIDRSPEMISFARATFPNIQFPNVDFHCMDACQIISDRQFDLVFSNAALHWVDDHPTFLHGANRVLHPGGRLFTSCGGKGNAAEIRAVLEELMQQESWKNYFRDFQRPWHFYDIPEYEHWLVEAGFQILNVELVPKEAIHTRKAGLAAWIRTTGMPYTHCLPESKREIFIEEYVNLYLHSYPLDEDGNARVKMVRLEVDAIKISNR